MLISQQGKILRMVTSDIRAIGRATQGVRLLGVEEGDQVVSVARLAERDENGSTDDAGASDVPEPVDEGTPEDEPPQD